MKKARQKLTTEEIIVLCFNKAESDSVKRFIYGLHCFIKTGLELTPKQKSSLINTYNYLFKEEIKLPGRLPWPKD